MWRRANEINKYCISCSFFFWDYNTSNLGLLSSIFKEKMRRKKKKKEEMQRHHLRCTRVIRLGKYSRKKNRQFEKGCFCFEKKTYTRQIWNLTIIPTSSYADSVTASVCLFIFFRNTKYLDYQNMYLTHHCLPKVAKNCKKNRHQNSIFGLYGLRQHGVASFKMTEFSQTPTYQPASTF